MPASGSVRLEPRGRFGARSLEPTPLPNQGPRAAKRAWGENLAPIRATVAADELPGENPPASGPA
jgi:hypothetical protein